MATVHTRNQARHSCSCARESRVHLPTDAVSDLSSGKLLVSLGADGQQELGKTSVVSFLKSPVRPLEGWGTRIAVSPHSRGELPLRAACT